MEVDAEEVVRVVLQFLQESNLQDAFVALENDAGVKLSLVADVSSLKDAIKQGHWAKAMNVLGKQRVTLDDELAWQIYERIVGDLVNAGEQAAAQELLAKSKELAAIKMRDGERFDALQDVVYHEFSAARRKAIAERADAKGETRRREELADAICGGLFETGPSKLLGILGDALAWRAERGIMSTKLLGPTNAERSASEQSALKSALMKTTRAGVKRTRDDMSKSEIDSSAANNVAAAAASPKKKKAALPCGSQVNGSTAIQLLSEMKTLGTPYSASFAPNGVSLAAGSSEGCIEIFDWEKGRFRNDLEYQAKDKLMSHSDSVLALCFGADSKTLVSGSKDGSIKMWSARSGTCKLRIKNAHLGKAVTCLALSRSNKIILSGGNDNCVRMFGTKNGTMQREFAGHQGQINQVVFFADEQKIASASSDHSCRLWDANTAGLLASVDLHAPVLSLVYSKISNGVGNVIVASGGPSCVAIIDAQTLQVQRTATSNYASGGDKDEDDNKISLRAIAAPRKAKRLLALDTFDRLHTLTPQSTGEPPFIYHNSGVTISDEVTAVFNHPTEPVLAVCSINERLQVFQYS